VAVVDVRSGTQVGLFEFTAGCEEIYDVQFLPGARRPMILNLERLAARQAVTNPESSWWLRPGAENPGETAAGKGDWSNLCEAPAGPFRQIGPVPFSGGTTGVSQHASPALPFGQPGRVRENGQFASGLRNSA
jgi:hypothetical protein